MSCARRALGPAALAVIVAGCNTGGPDNGGACRAAGGQCYVGNLAASCAQRGPDGCESDPPSPAGLFCCLAFVDAGGGG